ncbi:hypothetical protein S245_053587, partial [Arachis hypogaea]
VDGRRERAGWIATRLHGHRLSQGRAGKSFVRSAFSFGGKFGAEIHRVCCSVGISTLQIYENTSLKIEFTKKPKCVESSKWILFFDNEIEKACMGIGDPDDHNPDDPHIFLGTFTIKRAKFGYKLAFCYYESNCMDIGRFNKNGEGGRRLYLTKGEPFDVVFIESSSYNNGI